MKLRALLKTAIATTLVAGAVNAATLEERVEELEINNALNTFKFSGDLTMMYDNIETETTSTTTNNWNRLKFGLNFSAKPASDIQFHGRFAATKFWNALGDTYRDIDDPGQSRTYNGSDVYVEKAYFDYTLTDWMILSAGRLPTIDGVPYNYQYGKAKMGTYPKLAYASILDGVALTFKPGQFFLNQGSLDFRVIYTPFSNPNNIAGSANTRQSKGFRGTGETFPPTTSLYTLMLDYQSGDLGWADNLGFIAQWVKSDGLAVKEVDLGYNYDSVTSPGAGKAYPNRNILPADVRASLDLLTLHLELDNIMKSGVNFSVSDYRSIITETGGVCLFVNPANNCASSKGFFSDSTFGGTDEFELEGKGTLVALAWNSRMPTLMNAIIGGEFLTSDKGYQKFDSTADNMTGFYSTLGDAMKFYVTILPKNNFSISIGQRIQDVKYVSSTSGAFGPRVDATGTNEVTTTYATMRLDF